MWAYSGSVLHLYFSFVTLFLLPKFSNTHDPTLECTNNIKPGPGQYSTTYEGLKTEASSEIQTFLAKMKENTWGFAYPTVTFSF